MSLYSSDGLKLEQIVASIQEKLAPNARVKHNEKIRGKSEKSRQIDVSIRQTVGCCELLQVFECKDHGRPTDIDKVEAFVTKIRDVRAHAGFMVSPRGFTGGALAQAKEYNIMLLTLSEATTADWSSLVGKECWVALTAIKVDFLKVVCFPSADRNTMVHDGDGRTVDWPFEVTNLWKSQNLSLGKFQGEAWPVNWSFYRGRLIPVQKIVFSGYVRAFQKIHPLQFAEGKVLTESVAAETKFVEVSSQPFEWRALFDGSDWGKELSNREYQQARLTEVQILGVPKKWMRFSISDAPQKVGI